jgi:protein gp37
MDPSWARSLRDQCNTAGTKYFFKQTGSVLAREWGMEGKGHDLSRVPVDLRLREFPVAPTHGPSRVATAQVA